MWRGDGDMQKVSCTFTLYEGISLRGLAIDHFAEIFVDVSVLYDDLPKVDVICGGNGTYDTKGREGERVRESLFIVNAVSLCEPLSDQSRLERANYAR
jgi:hypothetical protein